MIAPAIVGCFLLCCGAAWSWNWYSHLPQPRRVTVTITPVAVTKLEKDLKYPPLVVRFSESAARLEDLKRPSLTGVRLEPQLSGSWHWADPNTLVFAPKEDWPADEKVRVVFDKRFFARHVVMERYVYETQTAPFAVTIKQLEIYQDPTNPRQREITATLELTHSVEPGELDRHLQISVLGGSHIFEPNDPAPHFSLTYGLHRRLVYLRSSPVALPPRDDFVKLTLSKGLRTAQGGAVTRNAAEVKLQLPSVGSMFRIDSIEPKIVRNSTGEPEQVLILMTTADISTRDLAKAVEIRLLPKREVTDSETATDDSGEDADTDTQTEQVDDNARPDGAEAEEQADASEEAGETELKERELWKSATDVPDEVVDAARRISFNAAESAKPQDRQHVFRVRVGSDGELYVRIHKGVKAFGDYPLGDDYNAVVRVPALPREVQIEGNGGVLALNGERKLSIRSRGIGAIDFEVARVATTQINHLVSQTEGNFQHPHFADPYLFNQENISRIATERQSIALENKWTPNYSAFDFSGYLRKPVDGGSERGLFFLTARGWDSAKKKPLNAVKDWRFVLVTDIGILTKKSADGSHDVFLMSLKEGRPLPNATVDLLGKNGVPLQSARTDANGRCAFGSVEKSTREKTPVAFVAHIGDDVSFIPFARDDRQINFSRFDIEGVDNVLPQDLDGFVFTERGIYRPGDEIHIGLVVKERDWAGALKGLPVETEVLDARGHAVQTRKVNLPESAFIEFAYQTANESPTGLYTFNVYLIKNTKRSTLLGSTTANVKEFLPDRMKIESRLSQNVPHGWINPKDTSAAVTLANLYGTPASDRRINARLELRPTGFCFAEFRDYLFFDPQSEAKKEREDQTVELGEKKTDESGRAQFDLQLERFADATYSMLFVGEGFEAEGGRSVTTTSGALISTLPYVIGAKPNGDLRYIQARRPRAVDLIAVDPELKRIALENVTVNIIAQEYVSVLTKQESGKYAYESVLKERVTKTETISVSAKGAHYELPTADAGNYIFEIRDDHDRRLARLQFCVAGQGNVTRSLEKNAELQVKLERAQYNSGDDVAISITAPYAGSGLITIERDRVYAQQWFTTNSASSVQHIQVPPNFEGSGYINLAFVRALDSKEIFVSPLSYAAVPFTANMEKRRLHIDLDVPVKTRPGEALHISYRTDRPARIAVFAVDEGILQVTEYKTPDPLAFYFRKCALRVETAQIVDQLLPEFSLLRSVSAFGGGGDIQRLNPFKRVTEKPVVFWSGIVNADTSTHEVVYDVPDYFDGTLKVMAVAIASDAVGMAEREALIRGPFVITPSIPVLAAPGDEFEAGVTVANALEGSAATSEIELVAKPNEHVSLIGTPGQRMQIAQGHEQTAIFKFHVNNKLGAAQISFVARAGGLEAKRRATLSVRPPAPYITDIRSGSFKTSVEVPITRDMHPEFRKVEATASAAPLGLAHGLDFYLKEFPYGCSEQITSGAFCRLHLADEADFGLKRADVNKQLEHTFDVLRRRQNDQGGFGYWAPEPGDKISFVSTYVMDFLGEAKTAGFPPPNDVFDTGLRNLEKMVGRQPADLAEARTVAYAIYVLTREGVITTNYILNLRDHLDKNERDQWQNDITGAYLAGALHLLHKDSDAEKLIAAYKPGTNQRPWDDFCQPLGSDSQYLAVLAREFPNRLRQISSEQLEKILGLIGSGEFNTLSAAYAVRALKAYSHAVGQNPPELRIIEVRKDRSEAQVAVGAQLQQRASFSANAKALRFSASRRLTGPGAFFQVTEAGFDRSVPNDLRTNGLEIYRELLGRENKSVTRTSLGEPLRVRLHLRSLRAGPISNIAVVDLLPGGFEVVDSSVRTGVSATRGVDYVDVREDRTIFFVTAPTDVLEIDYEIKSCNRGEFVVPPVFAESMYDRNVKARGAGGKITVTQ
jgi:uncharacterized protein YfaS (alpha-2-macroglobulin family)